MRSMIALSLSITAVALLFGCYDFDPITEGIPIDAGTDVEVEGGTTLCRACIDRECASAVAECEVTPRCGPFFACADKSRCFAEGSDRVACLGPCGAGVGLSGYSDPAIGPFMKLDLCRQSACSEACATP